MKRVAASMRNVDPCAKPNSFFRSGIATQLINSCVTCCDVGRTGTPNWNVGRDKTLDTTEWVRGWVLNQLSTRAQVTCEEEIGIRDRRRGGWWADSHRETTFATGSKLWSLKWSQTVNATLETAKRYAEEALSYLVTWGIADSVTVSASYVNKVVLKLNVIVVGPSFKVATTLQGQALPDYTWLWRAENAAGRVGR